MDVIVRGKVTAVEADGIILKAKQKQLRIDVDDCDKGSGPELLVGHLAAFTTPAPGSVWLDRSPTRFPTLQNTIAAHNMGCECLAEHYVPLVLKLIRYYENFNNG